MKLVILISCVALASCAKLERTYLPPSYAQTSGGNGNFLQAPGPQQYRRPSNGNGNAYAQTGNGFAQNGNAFAQNGNAFAQNENDFEQNENDYAQNGNNLGQSGSQEDYYNNNGFANDIEQRPERPQAAYERNAAILRQDSENDGETYAYTYETDNGIYAEESGVATNGVEAQGGYSYTGDDGQVYSVRYTAGQNGFVPVGDHLPTPPPVPEEILRALEQNARDEAAGIYDDGSYNEGKYNDNGNIEQYNDNNGYGNDNNGYENSNNGYGNANNGYYNNDNNDAVVVNSAQEPNQADIGVSQPARQYNQANNGFDQANNGLNQATNGFNQAYNRGSNGVTKAYLPPRASQKAFGSRTNGRNGFGSRPRKPTFNARDGYQY